MHHEPQLTAMPLVTAENKPTISARPFHNLRNTLPRINPLLTSTIVNSTFASVSSSRATCCESTRNNESLIFAQKKLTGGLKATALVKTETIEADVQSISSDASSCSSTSETMINPTSGSFADSIFRGTPIRLQELSQKMQNQMQSQQPLPISPSARPVTRGRSFNSAPCFLPPVIEEDDAKEEEEEDDDHHHHRPDNLERGQGEQGFPGGKGLNFILMDNEEKDGVDAEVSTLTTVETNSAASVDEMKQDENMKRKSKKEKRAADYLPIFTKELDREDIDNAVPVKVEEENVIQLLVPQKVKKCVKEEQQEGSESDDSFVSCKSNLCQRSQSFVISKPLNIAINKYTSPSTQTFTNIPAATLTSADISAKFPEISQQTHEENEEQRLEAMLAMKDVIVSQSSTIKRVQRTNTRLSSKCTRYRGERKTLQKKNTTLHKEVQLLREEMDRMRRELKIERERPAKTERVNDEKEGKGYRCRCDKHTQQMNSLRSEV